MKIMVSKIGAAKSQLIEAINLFFEERDPVSIHTLAGAALEVLNHHMRDINEIETSNLALHPGAPFIREEARKEWILNLNKFKNFFKHADRDIKNGITQIEFNTELNDFYILDGIRCLRAVQKEEYVFEPEFQVFSYWFLKKYPEITSEEARNFFKKIKNSELNTLKEYRDFLLILKNQMVAS